MQHVFLDRCLPVARKQVPLKLIRALLLRSGIEQNPGPRYPCIFCDQNCNHGSLQCSGCKLWAHLRCADITHREATRVWWKCFSCVSRGPEIPPNRYRGSRGLRVLQLNINGLRNKTSELSCILAEYQIDVAMIQETKLDQSTRDPSIPGYSMVRKDRDSHGGGIAILIKENLKYLSVEHNVMPDNQVECMTVEVFRWKEPIKIVNFYAPQDVNVNYQEVLSVPGGTKIVAGDANAHHDLWFSRLPGDARGEELAEVIDDNNLVIMNQNKHTRRPYDTTSRESSPDVTVVTTDIAPFTEWDTLDFKLSDHFPILITVESTEFIPKSEAHSQKRMINLRKACWDGFTEELERSVAELPDPQTVEQGEKSFRKAVKTASDHHIPNGRHHVTTPKVPAEIRRLIEQRDKESDTHTISQLNAEIISKCAKMRRDRWQEFIEENKNLTTGKLWQAVGRLTGKRTKPTRSALMFDGKAVSKPNKIANKMNRHFAESCETTRTKESRQLKRKTNSLKPNEEAQFSENEVHHMIKKMSNSKAIALDGMSSLHLKHFGPFARRYIAKLISMSFSTGRIPAIWKQAKVVALLKPGKPANSPSSYRPVSILSPIVRLAEHLLLQEMKNEIDLPTFQHGFKPGHSTTTVLCTLTEAIANGFNRSKPANRTVAVALDLKRAFDTVNIDKLVGKILTSELKDYTKKWLNNYLRGREQRTEYDGQLSKSKILRNGVPQGSVVSPFLFAWYLEDFPSPPEGIYIILYADDITIFSQSVHPHEAAARINQYLTVIKPYLEEKQLFVSPAKCSAMLFTTWHAERRTDLNIKFGTHEIQTAQNMKLLGIQLDQALTFAEHIKYLNSATRKRNNILRSMSNRRTGLKKPELTTIYKAITRSILNYAAPAWSPQVSNSNWQRIEARQNDALRTVTGCVKMTCADHLRRETRCLPVKTHCQMISAQFAAQAESENHPCHEIIHQSEHQPRHLKNTLKNVLQNARTELNISEDSGIKEIHTGTVRKYLNEEKVNRVLGTKPPLDPDKMEIKEKNLSRDEEVRIMQLRSGFFPNLADYKS